MAWSRLRWGYTPSTELCDRLAASSSPRRAHIVDPHYGRMLPYRDAAQAKDGDRSWPEGARKGEAGAWSPAFFKEEAEEALRESS
jgi:hypothetical protein